jgi:hypothetical protein
MGAVTCHDLDPGPTAALCAHLARGRTANNVLDDVEHCLKTDTSPHLAEY